MTFFIAIVLLLILEYGFSKTAKATNNTNTNTHTHITTEMTVVSSLPMSTQQNNAFRDASMEFVKKAAVNYIHQQPIKKDIALDKKWFNGGHPIVNWAMEVVLYDQGKRVGDGHLNSKSLSEGLATATYQALKEAHVMQNANANINNLRFRINFYYPPDSRQYSFIDQNKDSHQAVEWVGNVVPVRQMDTKLIKTRILAEKAYLLRMIDPDVHALFKEYYAKTDKRSERLRTIYTASSLFTLLKINDVFPDSAIQAQIKPMADFLLMMQETSGSNKGAFHYSYNKKTRQKENRFVVGTASKTIFTLLILYDKTHDVRYLNAAKLAGDWLVTKVDIQGHVNPVLSLENKHWEQVKKQSFLYSGQVLSALSRLYHVTKNKMYYDTATQIAKQFLASVSKQGPFVGDDFRTPNSVSTSWLVMSLLDYAKIVKAQNASIYRDTITRCARELIIRQANDSDDVFNQGRVVDLISASGNGWVNEVMTNLYPYCQANHMSDCESYRQFILNSSRWLMQNVYTSVNSIQVKNPAVADGGAIPNFLNDIVRTDAVCHGGNSLVGLLNMVGPEETTFILLPEMSLDEVLGLLGIGRFPELLNS